MSSAARLAHTGYVHTGTYFDTPWTKIYRHHENLTSNILQLAMATLGTTFAVPYLMTRGGSPKPQAAPPINAGSKDEAKFIE